MPEHTTFFSYLVAHFPALGQNMHVFGKSLFGVPVGPHGAEPLVASLFVMLLLVALAFGVRGQLVDYDKSVIPETKLTLAHVLRGLHRLLVRDDEGHDGPQAREAVLPARRLAGLLHPLLERARAHSRLRAADLELEHHDGLRHRRVRHVQLLRPQGKRGALHPAPLRALHRLVGHPHQPAALRHRGRVHAHSPAHAQHPSHAEHGGRPPAGHAHARDGRALPADPGAGPRARWSSSSR